MDGEPRRFGQGHPRLRADADDGCVGGQRLTVAERDLLDRGSAPERLDVDVEVKFDAMLGVHLAVEAGHLRAQRAPQRQRRPVDQRDLGTQFTGRGGDFASDPAGSNDHDALGGPEGVA